MLIAGLISIGMLLSKLLMFLEQLFLECCNVLHIFRKVLVCKVMVTSQNNKKFISFGFYAWLWALIGFVVSLQPLSVFVGLIVLSLRLCN